MIIPWQNSRLKNYAALRSSRMAKFKIKKLRGHTIELFSVLLSRAEYEISYEYFNSHYFTKLVRRQKRTTGGGGNGPYLTLKCSGGGKDFADASRVIKFFLPLYFFHGPPLATINFKLFVLSNRVSQKDLTIFRGNYFSGF